MKKAFALAQSWALIRPEIYSFSKLQTRQSVREAMDSKNKVYGDEIRVIWESKQTHKAIAKYVEKTLRK